MIIAIVLLSIIREVRELKNPLLETDTSLMITQVFI